MTAPTPRVWNHQDLVAQGLTMLAEGGGERGALIEGRILSVKATPENGSSSKMAVGLAVLPPDYEVPAHHHEAEELATIISGSGSIVIDDVEYPVTAGDVVLTPSNSVHITKSGPGEPMVVFWSYAPAGSENRWLEKGAIDQTPPS
ncbi:MAG: cupin domain-containing protein [Nitriliruptoraceae bacterium]